VGAQGVQMASKSSFDPNRLPFGTTLARQIAKQHLANLNNVFWVGERSGPLVRQSFNDITMPQPGPGIHGYYNDARSWQVAVDAFRLWSRQHVLVSAASLLEVYLKSASTAAFYACPELIDRTLDGVDSVTFIKFSDRLPKYFKNLVEEKSEAFTKGLWKERLHRLALVFGRLPEELLELEKDLQSLQNRRNRIAHSYGANGELRRTPWEPIKAVVVSPKEIIEITKSISMAISLLDEKVFSSRIGGYEIVHEFHVWCSRQKQLQKMRVSGAIGSAFRTHIGGAFGATPGSEYITAMIAYFNSIK
jgi:hypothetical protein